MQKDKSPINQRKFKKYLWTQILEKMNLDLPSASIKIAKV